MEERIYYFEDTKPENTELLLNIVMQKAKERGIKHVVVASTRGETGAKAAEMFQGTGINVVVVTHPKSPSGPILQEEFDKRIRTSGGKVVTTTFAFGGVGSSFRKLPPREPNQPAPQLYYPSYIPPTGELIANVLRLFSQGMKVCLEITVTAADSGAIPVGEDVIAVGGQGKGANTAIIVKSTNTATFFDLDVKEIIAKPNRKMLPRQ
jgi:hypothetical protein